MKHLKLITIVAVPLLFAAGCETMNQNDKAMLDKANSNAAEAKAASMKASADAQAAAAAARLSLDIYVVIPQDVELLLAFGSRATSFAETG